MIRGEFMDESDRLLNLGAKEYQKQTKEGFLKAIEYYQQSAKLGNGQAMCNLGYCYYYGRGIEVDKQKGFAYFLDSADAGCIEGIMKMGDFYRYGEIVNKNEEKAFDYYCRVYDFVTDEFMMDEYPEIFLRLGECYLKGIGVERDVEEARLYLEDAKELYENKVNVYFYYQKQLDKVNRLLEECKKV